MQTTHFRNEAVRLREELWKLWCAMDDADKNSALWAAKMDVSDAMDKLDSMPAKLPA